MYFLALVTDYDGTLAHHGLVDPAVCDALKRLTSGISIDGKRLAPCKIATLKDVDNPWLSITLIEGKNNQIRKMFDRIGHSVVKLKRIQIGFLRDPHLKPGDFRRLAPDEVKRFKSLQPSK